MALKLWRSFLKLFLDFVEMVQRLVLEAVLKIVLLVPELVLAGTRASLGGTGCGAGSGEADC